MRLLGAVLAGGRSRRFGSDKALAELAGEPLIAHSVAALRGQAEQVVVCGRDWPGLIGLPDRPAPDMGPLGGLNAALHHARAHGFDAVLTLGCDTPRVPGDLALRLAAPGDAAFVAGLPVVGLWPARLAVALDHHLALSADRSMRSWARVAGATAVEFDQKPANINTSSDLNALREGP